MFVYLCSVYLFTVSLSAPVFDAKVSHTWYCMLVLKYFCVAQ